MGPLPAVPARVRQDVGAQPDNSGRIEVIARAIRAQFLTSGAIKGHSQRIPRGDLTHRLVSHNLLPKHKIAPAFIAGAILCDISRKYDGIMLRWSQPD